MALSVQDDPQVGKDGGRKHPRELTSDNTQVNGLTKKSRSAGLASKPVDNLIIKVLVDNNIERFAELPAGFLDETPQQLAQDPPIDTELTGLPIMDLDNFCCGAHGLGLVITTLAGGEEHTILFDAGPDARALERNAKALKIEMGDIERIVLSHWHADHSGGIPSALRLIAEEASTSRNATPTIVDLHPGRPIARGNARANKPVARQAAGPTFQQLKDVGAIVELHDEPHTVSGGAVFVSGEVPRLTSFEHGFLGGIEWVEHDGKGGWNSELGELVKDERYLVVNVKGKGLVIFSACSHAGIVNVVKDAQKHFPGVKVHMVIGGLHLGGKNMEYRVKPTVDFFANEISPKATHILPLHCTGFKARAAFLAALGDACIAGGTGLRIDISGAED